MSDASVHPSAHQLAAAVQAMIEPVFASLEDLAGEVVSCRRDAPGPSTERSFAPLEAAIAPRLAAHPALAGMGYVAAPGVVAGQDRFLIWWQRSGDDLARLRLNFDPSSVDVYDYLQMEWFQEAQAGGARNAFGPYVDYSGSGLYVVTASVPVVADDSFLGVTGADIVMAELERRVIAILRTSGVEAVAVNGERRVVAANTSRWVVGERLAQPPARGDGVFTDVAEVPRGLGWCIAVGDRPVLR
ncbi:MAG: cache domain-containing protein [Nocardioidaceae bacterium]